MEIKVFRGSEADQLLTDDTFCRQWSELHAICPWATVLQALPFATAWYTAYRTQYEPVLVVSRNADGALTGLMTLARSSKADLVPVGSHQAEYHTWLATPEQGNAFPTAAFAAIGRAFPSSGLTFKYLPPGTPLEWMQDGSPIASRCVLATFNRPMMDLSDTTAIDKCLKRRNIRTRLNKLVDNGYAGIERITDAADLEKHLDEIIAWHDFRRVTVSGVGPFENDPLKRQFHVEMLKQGALCATVLKMEDRVVSMQLDMLGREVVHLALGAYAPWLSKFALGKIHILEVARMLRNEGVQWVDLTPGNDPYKAEFATKWETVHALTVCPGRMARQRSRLALRVDGFARWALDRIGSDPVAAKIAMRNLRTRPLATLVRPVLNLIRRWKPADRTVVYSMPASRLQHTISDDTSSPVNFDCVADWLACQPSGFEAARHACLSDATRRFGEGMQSFTMIEDDRLRFSCWLAEQPSQVLTEQQLAEGGWGEHSAVLLDIRTYGGDRGSAIATALPQAVRAVARRPQVSTVLVVVSRADRKSIGVLEEMGFTGEPRSMGLLTAAGSRVAAAINGGMLSAALEATGMG